MRVRRSFLLLAALALGVLAVACAGDAAPTAGRPTEGDDAAATAAPAGQEAAGVVLAGTLHLPAASYFGDLGFHESFVVRAVVPDDAGSGRRLVVALNDATRPEQRCSQEHPLSGCATVDWSDQEGRPNVPPGGVFDNSVTLELASGPRTLYLSESGSLAAAPDSFDPG